MWQVILDFLKQYGMSALKNAALSGKGNGPMQGGDDLMSRAGGANLGEVIRNISSGNWLPWKS